MRASAGKYIFVSQEISRLEAEVQKLQQGRNRPTELPSVLDTELLRTQITQLEIRLHSQEKRLQQEMQRADAAEIELAHLRHQPLFVD